MSAISDIIITAPRTKVWSVIADPSSHSHWLSPDCVTTYDGELAEGMKFTRLNKQTGTKSEGEVVAMRAGYFLKVRVDAPQEAFATTEYHLLSIAEGCALRVLCEIYDAGETRHVYFPEMMEQQWQGNLERLKRLCESV
jgi:uncharacterized protein YndB with AHSA1/START domain